MGRVYELLALAAGCVLAVGLDPGWMELEATGAAPTSVKGAGGICRRFSKYLAVEYL